MSYLSKETEIQCVVHWFCGWSNFQKREFQKLLLDKAIPCYLDYLFDSLNSMNVNDKPPSIFECQLKVFNQWFDAWTVKDKNAFMVKLREVNFDFVDEFDRQLSVMTSLQNNSWTKWSTTLFYVYLISICVLSYAYHWACGIELKVGISASAFHFIMYLEACLYDAVCICHSNVCAVESISCCWEMYSTTQQVLKIVEVQGSGPLKFCR